MSAAKITSALALALTVCPAGAATQPFEVVKGSWVGGGALSFKDGRNETLTCNAYYTSSAEGNALTAALRCNGPSGKFELRSHLSYAGGKVDGSWEERTYNGRCVRHAQPRQPAPQFPRRRRWQHDGRLLRREPNGLDRNLDQ